MTRSVRIHEFGNPDVLQIEDVAVVLHGTLRPTIDRTFAFDEIAAARRLIDAGEQVGKIVATV